MIFLDNDDQWLLATSRSEMVDALLAHLPAEPDNATLIKLASACLECANEDVMVMVMVMGEER